MLSSKIARGFDNFQSNTGTTHPNDNGALRSKLAKRSTGKDPLTDDLDGELWQGAVSVGTPANTFTGGYFLLPRTWNKFR